MKIWKNNNGYSFSLGWGKRCNLSYRVFSLPSLGLTYCSKDIREMGSTSHGINCQACCGGIECIICLLLAPIWMSGEDLCHSRFSQGSYSSVTLWVVQYNLDFNVIIIQCSIIKRLSKLCQVKCSHFY